MHQWQTKKLGEVCNLIKGKKPKNFVLKSNKPYLTAKVVRGTEEPKFAAKNCPSSISVKGEDIVIIMDGSNSGEMFTGLEGVLASTMGIVKYPKDLLNSKYLLHFLRTHRENFTKSRTGAAIPHLNKEGFENLEIPLPPLTEQQRIVKILDEAFEGVAKAKENAEKNLKNAEELFESYLQSSFLNAQKKSQKTELGVLLAEIRTGPFGSALHKSDYVSDGIPVINPQDIQNGKIMPLGKTMVSELTKQRLAQYILKKKDIIFARRGEMGRCAMITQQEAGWLCGTGSLIMRFKNNVDERYMLLLLQSEKIKRTLEGASVGTTMDNLNQGILKSIQIHLPSLAEQKSIVAKLDALSAETKKLEAIYEKKLTNLEELKKSVLKKAFNGELS